MLLNFSLRKLFDLFVCGKSDLDFGKTPFVKLLLFFSKLHHHSQKILAKSDIKCLIQNPDYANLPRIKGFLHAVKKEILWIYKSQIFKFLIGCVIYYLLFRKLLSQIWVKHFIWKSDY